MFLVGSLFSIFHLLLLKNAISASISSPFKPRFGMSVAGNVQLTLVSMTGSSVPDDALFPLGIGLPIGTGCTASVDAAAKPGGSPQFAAAKGAGVYCVRIADNARLGAAANFVLNITHPR